MIKSNHKLILELIATSSFIRNKLSFKEHLKMYHYFNNLSEASFNKQFSGLKIPYKDPTLKTDWWIRAGLVSVILVLPIPGLTEILISIKNAQNYKCRYECLKNIKTIKNQKLCYMECEYISTKFCVDFLERELRKCRYNKKPSKCKSKIFKLLSKWSIKLEKSKLNLDFQQRSHAFKISQKLKLKLKEDIMHSPKN